MKVRLYHRHHGKHEFLKEETIVLDNEKIVFEFKSETRGIDYRVEDKELAEKVKSFLPCPSSRCLLTVGDEGGSTGISDCQYFSSWGKYFDSYVLELPEPNKGD